MLQSVKHGREGTAMMGFANVLSDADIAAVVDFVRTAFMSGEARNTRYHTPGNGWPDHQRYADAFVFATGELPLDTPWEKLSAAQRRGKRLFMQACVTCHDRATVAQEGEIWNRRSVSFPRGGFRPGDDVDATSSSSPYASHDVAPRVAALSEKQRLGESLFQSNCAFCHAADGTGKNWIGSFLQPHPRDLTSAEVARRLSREELVNVITRGIDGSTMPAWGTVLSPDEIGSIADYVLKVFFEPALTAVESRREAG